MMSNVFKKALTLAILTSAVTLTSCQKDELINEPNEQNSLSTMNGQAIKGQYIVVMKSGSSDLNAVRTDELSASDRVSIRSIRQRLITDAHIETSSIKETYDGAINGFTAQLTPEQLKDISNDPNVAYVEQDRIITLGKPTTTGGNGKGKKSNEPEPAPAPAPTEPTPTPTEPAPTQPAPTPVQPAPTDSYTKITPKTGELVPWNISRVGYGDGTGKTVWIIDSGIDTDHPDLTIDINRSVSFIYGTTSIEDGYGHGTTVAGIIAAKNNGSGMIGVASGATVVALRVFDDAGAGTMSRAISAVNHVISYGAAGDVVNMSLGGGISSTLDNAVRSAAAKGIMFSIASGNSATDCINNSPARVDATNVYTITAMDRYDRFGTFSNFGVPVDYSAPGVNVTSTQMGGSINHYNTGTSFAAPHVAGILLLRGKVYSGGIVIGDVDGMDDPISILN
jgi:hypothetical protein